MFRQLVSMEHCIYNKVVNWVLCQILKTIKWSIRRFKFNFQLCQVRSKDQEIQMIGSKLRQLFMINWILVRQISWNLYRVAFTQILLKLSTKMNTRWSRLLRKIWMINEPTISFSTTCHLSVTNKPDNAPHPSLCLWVLESQTWIRITLMWATFLLFLRRTSIVHSCKSPKDV